MFLEIYGCHFFTPQRHYFLQNRTCTLESYPNKSRLAVDRTESVFPRSGSNDYGIFWLQVVRIPILNGILEISVSTCRSPLLKYGQKLCGIRIQIICFQQAKQNIKIKTFQILTTNEYTENYLKAILNFWNHVKFTTGIFNVF